MIPAPACLAYCFNTMREEIQKKLAPLLSVLRGYSVLREVREGSFHLDGKDFIHFHDEPDGLWADVRLAGGRVRRSVADADAQADLLEEVGATLDAVERASAGRRKARRRRSDFVRAKIKW